MEKYDTSQLTEFPRFESESSQSGVSTFFNKIWKFPIFSPSESNDNLQNKALTDGKEPNQQTEDQNKQDYDDKPETGSYAVEFEGRSLPNVLRRISSLVALGSGGGTRYADTELARYWMPDDISRECYECAARFSTLRRRHHCRVCGQIFCSRCCSQRVPGQIFGCAGGLRVCNYCCNVVLSYLRENDMCGEISPDLRTLQENLQVKFPENKSSLQSKKRDNFIFAREQEERCEVRTSPKEALQDVFRQLSFTLPTQQHRYRLVRYNGVWRGCDMLQWIMDNTNNKTRAQASQVCQYLVLAGYIECCTELPQFADYALYKPIVLPPVPTQGETPEELSRLTESVSSYCLDLNLGEHSARLTRTAKTGNKTSPSSDEENPILDQTEGSHESRKVCKAIEESGEDHLKLMMRQCLAREGLSSSWLDVLFPLCQQAVIGVLPDLFSNDIDVRHYVQVKKVPGGGAIKESCVVPGVMMTKNVVHRGMPQYIPNPSILLLDCSIAYQRVEGKLTSLEPVLMQEQEYLVRCAARISALRPKVVLVKGTAARVVQDVLRKEGVAMCVGVGARALTRVALTTGASLVTSVDARIAAPRLGAAASFRVTNYTSKTLVTLENCAEPQLGCCLLLRGASLSELVRVKKVARFMLLACYNWKLEKSFLNDIEAVLPEPGMTFDDDDDASEKQPKSDEPKDQKLDDTDIEKLKSEDNSQQDNDKTTKDPKTENSIENEDASHDNNDKSRSETEQDPLKARFTRKTDSDKNLSCGVPIRDFSDPLRATLSVDEEVFLPKEETLKADTHNDRWSTDDAVLSMSPNVVMSGAFLASVGGRAHPLRRYFPEPLFRRAVPPPATPRARRACPDLCDVKRKELHLFVRRAITSSVEDPTLRASLAHYRASGATHQPSEHKGSCPLYNPSILMKEQKEESEERQKEKEQTDPLDPLAPENHQRLSLLFYSYSDKSANVPDFCVNPWIMTIEMYGRKDITLGAFLEKYCFNTENKCPSSNCSVPMNQHVRRFVHNDVCITITCNTIGHSNVDKSTEENTKQVMFWSRCGVCGACGAARRLSRTSLALSLGTYCGLRARTARYTRALCPHPLHQHAHAFQAQLTTACFKYSKISTWEIELPAEVISINYDTKCMRDSLINQLNELMLKGHETFSVITDSEAGKDHLNFKQHMEHIHLALTSANLQEQTSLAGVVRSLWNIADRIIAGEKMLRDAQDKWSSPAKPGKVQDIAEEKSSDLEDSGAGESSNENSEIISRDETERGGTEEDEEKGDKKTVRQILSQLLSNNQPANQSGMIISHGLLPVVVFAGEIGSVIAATLASATYQRGLTSLYSTQTEQEETETTNTGKEKTDGDKSKAAKSNDHIEVLLKDGLLCRVYYAPQFHRLRHLLLAPLSSNPHITDEFARTLPSETEAKELRCCVEDGKDKCDNKNLCEIEEGFIRSLAQCVPWAACGGKSGSTFCKTKDDRYVLKEMTKPEWQQFLEFAPHYFNYIVNCHNNQLPTLLARILGVYSVGGAGNGVLVMENLLYACSPASKTFDLKGSSRSRLTPESTAPRVLMDDNLLRLRWDTQFYLQSHTARVLRAAVERDTGFLAANCVMDYSLLLGVDENRLVVGIIDYIRTFTWDKKLEHYVKKNLRSGTPTVVSPDQYRARFIHAMNKYFLHCPDHWDHFVTLK